MRRSGVSPALTVAEKYSLASISAALSNVIRGVCCRMALPPGHRGLKEPAAPLRSAVEVRVVGNPGFDRGGAFDQPAHEARFGNRAGARVDTHSFGIGVRAVRRIEGR